MTFEDVEELNQLKKLNRLRLPGANVNEAGLKVTDGIMKEISKLTNLVHLTVTCKLVTDDVLLELVSLKKLRTLNLQYSAVTEVGVQEFREAVPKCETYLSQGQ